MKSQGINPAIRSYAFVAVQFACLGALGLSGPLIATRPELLLLQGLAAALGLWAIWELRVTRLNVLPDLLDGAVLVTSGPYRLLRHPIYSALLLATLALVLNQFSLLRLLIWSLLLLDLALKLRYEEQQLTAVFPAYDAYRRRTWRLLPLIF